MGFLSNLFSGAKDRDPETDSAIVALHGKTIAGVESSATIQKILELTMVQAGVSWLPFGSVQELLAGAASSKPDVAILSVGDLGADIAPVLNQIRSEFTAIRIVLLTDVSHDLDATAASQLGADAVHRKPFKADELLVSISRLLNW
ncbi:MAG: response regulator [bacterium]|nr:response regulator [bacterium]